VSPLASVVIPSYNHAQWLGEAIDCALAQTVACEVIVVDDGSTDRTPALIQRYGNRIRSAIVPHAGPSRARNHGLDLAQGEFVMLLDADDLIAPTKVAKQLAAFTPEIGWALCDVQIEDEAKGTVTTASRQYDYATRALGGWIQPQLVAGNFIPIMSPLVRRSVLEGIRFDDRLVPEDWHFWSAVAGAARVRYVPEVLATYRHRRTGRSRLPKKARIVRANITDPLRLNLGCGTPGTRSWHPIDGFVNLDKSMGWRFEDGLGDFIDRSVEGITVSHALMYVPESEWPAVFAEFARVLRPGGVVRITEDHACHPASSRLGGWKGSQPAVTLTSPELVIAHLERAGLSASEVGKQGSTFHDLSLCQAQHGDPPDVFFVEGQRIASVLFAPHNDDEALFGAFTILRHRPHVVVCFPSARDYGDSAVREAETRDAMSVLGAAGVEQWSGGDVLEQMTAFDRRLNPSRVWAPDLAASHPDHRAVAEAALSVFGERVTTYHTYIDGEKVRSDKPVAIEPPWIEQKLRALARYTSQIAHPRAHAFFLNDLREYYGTERVTNHD
jgi:glycosyltransferase involved in cell wall biosynthesis/LmbE family N-acetylglucosaminyl deacetylase